MSILIKFADEPSLHKQKGKLNTSLQNEKHNQTE